MSKFGHRLSCSFFSFMLWSMQWAAILWISYLATSLGSTVSDSHWFYVPNTNNDTSMAYAILLLVEYFLPGIMMCAWKTILSAVADVPSVVWDTFSPYSLSNLHNEIHNHNIVEDDDATNSSTYISTPQVPPAARRITPWHAIQGGGSYCFLSA